MSSTDASNRPAMAALPRDDGTTIDLPSRQDIGPQALVNVWVEGEPIPQGSMNARCSRGRGYIYASNGAKLRPWRARVAGVLGGSPRIDGPIFVRMTFYVTRPQRPRWQSPAVRPDLDKLVRAVLDAATDSGVIEDDARVVGIMAEKRYPEDTSGVRIVIGSAE